MSRKLASRVASIAAAGTLLFTTRRLIATLTLPVLFWAMPSPATAFEGDTPKFGGGGGAEFHAHCGPGRALAGFRYETGKDLDNISMKCRSMNGARADGAETAEGGMFGRDDNPGQFAFNAVDTLTCSAPMVVQAMSVMRSATVGLVHKVRFTCRNLETGERADTRWTPTTGGKGGQTGYADCGDNGYAVGLWGASGALIDALGLTCAEYHRPAPPPLASPPPAPVKPIKHMAHGGPAPVKPIKHMAHGGPAPATDPCINAQTAREKHMPASLISTFENQCRLRGGDPNAPAVEPSPPSPSAMQQPEDESGAEQPEEKRQTPPFATANFDGNWSSDVDDVAYSISLTQQGNSVSGRYRGADGSAGQISGQVSGNVLRFSWMQKDGNRGSGKFVLSADGESFDGSYSLSNNPDAAEGSWNGRRR